MWDPNCDALQIYALAVGSGVGNWLNWNLPGHRIQLATASHGAEHVCGILDGSHQNTDDILSLRNQNDKQYMEDIINITKTSPAEDYAKQETGKFLWTQAEGIDVNSEKYSRMVKQEQYYGGEGGILGAMEKYKLDVLVTPFTPGVANHLAAKMGFPVITVPLGFHPDGILIEHDHGGMITVAPGMPCVSAISPCTVSIVLMSRILFCFPTL